MMRRFIPPCGAKTGMRKRFGFSLVEVMVALFILTVGIAGLIPMLAFNVRSNHFAKSVSIANYLAEKHLEKIRAWPVYDTTSVDGNTRIGIVSTNTALFGTWTSLNYPDLVGLNIQWDETFNISSELYHNGYTLGCAGGGATFGGSTGNPPVDEGSISTYGPTWPDGSVNEGIKGDCTGSNYRGEDFKVARVTVTWIDKFNTAGTHTIQRQVYIAKF